MYIVYCNDDLAHGECNKCTIYNTVPTDFENKLKLQNC